MNDPQQSVTMWLDKVKQGNSQAALALHRSVFERLVRLARRRIGVNGMRWADEEDVALSAFDHFCAGAVQGKFPQLENRDDLWKILVRITSRKARDYLRLHHRQKRGDGLVRGDSAFTSPEGSVLGMQQAADSEPSPELHLIVAEECRLLLECLQDEALQQIAVWKMEGYKDVEIAEKLDCAPRTVARKLDRIREKWKQAGDD